MKTQPSLKWAPPNLFKPILDEEFLARLGPKDERDKRKEGSQDTSHAAATKKQDTGSEPERSMFSEGFLGICINQVKNPQMYPELLEEHKSLFVIKSTPVSHLNQMDFCTLVTLRPLWLILGTLNSTRVLHLRFDDKPRS